MKRYAKPVLIAAIVSILAGLHSPSASAEVSFGFFYSNLSPHGSWLVSADYGRVWRPGVYAAGWNPYYDGHWVYSDFGWTWVSDYEWGAIPYHYGTWVFDPRFGWVWVPGTIWAPAWVVFRTSPDYIGWAPVSPRFTLGMSINFVEPRPEQFLFVSAHDFLSPRVRRSVVVGPRRTVIINKTKIVNNLAIEGNVVVNRGPGLHLIEKASGRQVHRVRIEEVPRAAPGRRLDRAQLRVGPRGKRELRVSTPTSEREHASVMERRAPRQDGRDGVKSRESARPPRYEPKERGEKPERRSTERGSQKENASVVTGPVARPDRRGTSKPQVEARPPRREPKQKREERGKPRREKGAEHQQDRNRRAENG
jgi:uncharacterized protein DUF6600